MVEVNDGLRIKFSVVISIGGGYSEQNTCQYKIHFPDHYRVHSKYYDYVTFIIQISNINVKNYLK